MYLYWWQFGLRWLNREFASLLRNGSCLEQEGPAECREGSGAEAIQSEVGHSQVSYSDEFKLSCAANQSLFLVMQNHLLLIGVCILLKCVSALTGWEQLCGLHLCWVKAGILCYFVRAANTGRGLKSNPGACSLVHLYKWNQVLFPDDLDQPF